MLAARRCLSGRTAATLPRLSGNVISRRSLSIAPNALRLANSSHSSNLKADLSSAPLMVSQRSNFHVSALQMAETVKVPQMAESISEGTLKQWNKKKGDYVNADEEVATIETDKIDVSVNAPKSGTIVDTFANEEDTVTVGQDLFSIEEGEAPEGGSSGGAQEESSGKGEEEDGKKKEEEQQQQQQEQEQKQEQEQEQKDQQKQQKQKQDAQKKEQQQKDTKKSSEKKPEPSSKSQSSSAKSEQAPSQPGSREERRVKMSRMRLRIAERLKQSQNTAASLTTFNEVDMSALMGFRARHKDRLLKETGIKLGFMGAFAKASALALKEIPAANASIEGEGLGDTIVYRDYVDLGVAVSTDKGLVTPVVRNVESLGMLDIERSIAELGKKARDNKLTLEDMAGSTFTISNGGVFGSLFGTPILNLPASAILGMHAIKEKPWVVEGGKIEARPIMVIALTYDHRLLDGREAVTFLVKLKQYLEDPGLMAL
ncbi:dihydrolipoamide succinyltransferase [Meira miltonrushii]|uniref:dihydrolipoyllysine-residue succinyltransferase n=1 Tax=Meira miltonrushii TaxID=1280837 RepID=A0A316V2V9_9BASI|nr:dihydrolipoamide succinyltransferase [Meira miltonrushii]PWN31899.1 dihydrolipoamide succinyltransferase [Meira miltonrushii]